MPVKADVLAQLQTEILSLQGYKQASASAMADIGLEHINKSFPNGVFPLAALHEFYSLNKEEGATCGAFITALLSSFMRKDSTSFWISSARTIFPPALKSFGINPDQILFVDLKKEKEVVWAVEEALRCKALTAVVGELSEISFTASRRLQLAIEQSGVPCFVLRSTPRNLATASVTRWRLKPLSSIIDDGLPGVGFPRWQVELIKVRNGKPGVWDLQWIDGRFRHNSKLVAINRQPQKKTG